MEDKSRKRLAALRKKVTKERKKSPVEIAGADLAPVGWSRRVVSFGSGLSGQLGTSALLDTKNKQCSVQPCWVSLEAAGGDYEVREPLNVVCSSTATYSVMESGSLFAWGTGTLGCRPDDNAVVEVIVSKTRIPRHVEMDVKVQLVASSPTDHCLLLTTTGAVYSWGNGTHGKLGLGDSSNRIVPTSIHAIQQEVQWVGCGAEYSAALTVGGSLSMWGNGSCGQLGNGTVGNANVPTQVVAAGLDRIQITHCAAGYEHVLAITAPNHVVYAWGNNVDGRLGELVGGGENDSNKKSTTTTTQAILAVPTPIDIGKGFVTVTSIAAGHQHSLALTSQGLVFAWGSNTFGQLGLGKKCKKSTVVVTPHLVNVPQCSQLSCGFAHSGCVTIAGDVYMWGQNDVGQLGIGERSGPKCTPVQIQSLEKYWCEHIAIGQLHTGIVFRTRTAETSLTTTTLSLDVKRAQAKDTAKELRKEWKAQVEAHKRWVQEQAEHQLQQQRELEEKKEQEREDLLVQERLRKKQLAIEMQEKLKQAQADKVERKRVEALKRAQREKELRAERAAAAQWEKEEKDRLEKLKTRQEENKRVQKLQDVQNQVEQAEQDKLRKIREEQQRQERERSRERERVLQEQERLRRAEQDKQHQQQKLEQLKREQKLQKKVAAEKALASKVQAENERRKLAQMKRDQERKEKEQKDKEVQRLALEKKRKKKELMEELAIARKLEMEKYRLERLKLRKENKRNELARKKAREVELDRKEKERQAWLEEEQRKRKEALVLATKKRKKKEHTAKVLQLQQEMEAKNLIENIRLQEEENAAAELLRRKEKARLRMIEKAQQKRAEHVELEKRKKEVELLAQEQENSRKKMEKVRIQKARKHRIKKEQQHQEQFIQACQTIVDTEQKIIDAKQRRRKEAQAWMEKKDGVAKETMQQGRRAPMYVFNSYFFQYLILLIRKYV